MNRIPTFINGNFVGWRDMKEINRFRNEAHSIAADKQKKAQADHMIYGYYSIDDDGEIETARFYSGIEQDNEKFETVTAAIPKAHIYAIHKH